MKVVDTCKDAPEEKPLRIRDVKVGTVFRYNDYSHGPYLRVDEGYVNLQDNGYFNQHYINLAITSYIEYPHARVVLEEQ